MADSKGEPDDLLVAAQDAFFEGSLKDAADLCREFLALKPRDGEAHGLLLDCLLGLQNLEAAVVAGKAWMKACGPSPMQVELVAKAAYFAGDVELLEAALRAGTTHGAGLTALEVAEMMVLAVDGGVRGEALDTAAAMLEPLGGSARCRGTLLLREAFEAAEAEEQRVVRQRLQEHIATVQGVDDDTDTVWYLLLLWVCVAMRHGVPQDEQVTYIKSVQPTDVDCPNAVCTMALLDATPVTATGLTGADFQGCATVGQKRLLSLGFMDIKGTAAVPAAEEPEGGL